MYTIFVSEFGTQTQKSIDTQSSQYYNRNVLNRKEISMYCTSIVVIIGIISVLLGIELKVDGFVL